MGEKVLKKTTREELARDCLRIERQNGDVLAYLKGKGYIYSTRSTWENLQRQILHRSDSGITDGKPKEAEELARRKNWKSEEFRSIAEEAVLIAQSGSDPRVFLRSKGYADTAAAWMKVKRVYREDHPDAEFPILAREKKYDSPEQPRKQARPQTAGNGAEASPEPSEGDNSEKAPEAPTEPKPPQKQGVSGGYIAPEEMAKQAAEALGERMGYSVRVSPAVTCCAKSPRKGVEVPDEIPDGKPERSEKMVKVIMVETEMGTFKREGDSIIFRRNDNDKDYNNVMQLSPEGWRSLMADMEEVLNKLSFGTN